VELLVAGDADCSGCAVAAKLAAAGHDLRAMVADRWRFVVARR
jgi:nucleoside-diphosphate-sugar epimerase